MHRVNMSVLMLALLISLDHAVVYCYGSPEVTTVPTRSDTSTDLYGELVARIQRLEKRDQQQASQITTLESKMAAMAAVIEGQQHEIETLKQRKDDELFALPIIASHGDIADTEQDFPSTDVRVAESAIRETPGPQSGRKLVRKDAVNGKVAFFARVDVTQVLHLGANQNIKFEKVVVNIGNAYNAHQGVFIAPLSGTYLFSASIVTDRNREVWAHVAVNGSSVARIFARGSDGRHDQGTQTVVLELRKGDDVTVQNEIADDGILGQEFCSFSGLLLWPTLSESVIVG